MTFFLRLFVALRQVAYDSGLASKGRQETVEDDVRKAMYSGEYPLS